MNTLPSEKHSGVGGVINTFPSQTHQGVVGFMNTLSSETHKGVEGVMNTLPSLTHHYSALITHIVIMQEKVEQSPVHSAQV